LGPLERATFTTGQQLHFPQLKLPLESYSFVKRFNDKTISSLQADVPLRQHLVLHPSLIQLVSASEHPDCSTFMTSLYKFAPVMIRFIGVKVANFCFIQLHVGSTNKSDHAVLSSVGIEAHGK
jgi:hypothetical protein